MRKSSSFLTSVALLFAATTLAGCSWAGLPFFFLGQVDVPSQPPFEGTDIVARANTLAKTGMSRAQVIDTLGEPRIGGESRGVDFFFQSESQRDWTVSVLPPVPFPAGDATHYAAYTLISYDTSGHVDAVDAVVVTYEGSPRGAILRAGDYALCASPNAENAVLAVTYERFLRDWQSLGSRNDYASAARRADCALLLGTTANQPPRWGRPSKWSKCFPDLMRIDSRTEQKPLPAASRWAGRFAEIRCGGRRACNWKIKVMQAVTLAAGAHRLRFGSTSFEGEFGGEITCRPAEVTFAALECEATERHSWWRKMFWPPGKWGKMTGHASFSTKAPDDMFFPNFVLLNEDGKWLLE